MKAYTVHEKNELSRLKTYNPEFNLIPNCQTLSQKSFFYKSHINKNLLYIQIHWQYIIITEKSVKQQVLNKQQGL